MPTHIYQRPHGEQGSWSAPIKLVGVLQDYQLGVAYEGRLQIIDSVGPHTVRQSGGDQLPNGSSIFVDEATNEVVVQWPPQFIRDEEINEYPALLPNSGFEEHASKNWKFVEGVHRTSDNPITGTYSAVFQGGKGIATFYHATQYPVIQGRNITAKAKVRQGASDSGNAGACVVLLWLTEDGVPIKTIEGNRVMKGKGNRTADSTLTVMPPADAKKVSIGGRFIRKRQGRDIWMDDFSWDHITVEVIEAWRPNEEFYVEIEVKDSYGRLARWTGNIYLAGNYITSKMYPIQVADGYDSSADLASFRYGDAQKVTEAYTSGVTLDSFAIAETLKKYTYTDAYNSVVVLDAFTIRDVLKKTATVDAYDSSMSLTTFSIKSVLITARYLPEGYNSEVTLTEFSIS